MEHLAKIYKLETRAKGLKLSIAQVCSRAGVKRTTFWQCKSRGRMPSMRLYNLTIAKMEAVLAAEEARLLEVLRETIRQGVG